jgi:Recombination endonuclease VII
VEAPVPSNSSTSSEERFELQPGESRTERRKRLRREWTEANDEQYRARKHEHYLRNREQILERQKEAYRANPQKWREANRLRNFGLTQDEFNTLLKAQDDRCAICKTRFSLTVRSQGCHVDHNHSTDEIRGLLCHLCNVALGCAHDNPKLLRKMARYLERSKPPT